MKKYPLGGSTWYDLHIFDIITKHGATNCIREIFKRNKHIMKSVEKGPFYSSRLIS